jgi:AcrR family transcriptional regulator
MTPDPSTQTSVDSRPGYSAGRRSRADIVNAACAVIAEQGYEALTVASLAERAGMSKGGLYHHFERMTDVVIAAYEATVQSIVGDLKTGRPEDFDAYLSEVESVVFDRLLKDPKSLRIISELYPRLMFDPSFRVTRQASFNHVVEVMSGVFAESFRSKIDQHELRMAIKSVGVFLIGLVVQHGANQDLEQSREQWQWFKATLNARLDGNANADNKNNKEIR